MLAILRADFSSTTMSRLEDATLIVEAFQYPSSPSSGSVQALRCLGLMKGRGGCGKKMFS